MSGVLKHIDLSQQSLWVAAGAIAFNPTFWNIAARLEYHKKVITKLFGGNPYYGCYALAVTIFSLGILRDTLFERALRDQPSYDLISDSLLVKFIGGSLFLGGNVLVLSSMWALGITGTYLGDYFGILMDEMVTGFPFNIAQSPMYMGSTLCFLGTSLWYGKAAGLLLTCEVFMAYAVALTFEDPFTAEIYAKRERDESKKEE